MIIILIIIHLNSYLVSLLYDTFNYYLLFYYYLSIYFSFLLFISHFIFIFAPFFYIYFLFWPFLCLNFVLPISPTVLYCFKCYPNWPQILREERQGGPKKKKVQVANYFVFAVVSLSLFDIIITIFFMVIIIVIVISKIIIIINSISVCYLSSPLLASTHANALLAFP